MQLAANQQCVHSSLETNCLGLPKSNLSETPQLSQAMVLRDSGEMAST